MDHSDFSHVARHPRKKTVPFVRCGQPCQGITKFV